MSALRSAGFPACGFWGHSCPHFQELGPHPLLITPWGLYAVYFGVRTLSDFDAPKWHCVCVMNPVQRRIGELASLELGPRKRAIRSVSRKEVIPDRRYSWRLYADEKGNELVDVVVLDVNLGVALDIDIEVREQMQPANPRSVVSALRSR